MNTATNPGELIDRLERFIRAVDVWSCVERQSVADTETRPPHLVACFDLQFFLRLLLRSSPGWLIGDIQRAAEQLWRGLSHAISLRGQRGTLLTGEPSMRAACQMREAAKRMLDHREMLTEQRRPMTDGQRGLWNALDGKAMNTKELADALNTSPGTVRQRKLELCQDGYVIERRPGRGYYRPDTPPSDL